MVAVAFQPVIAMKILAAVLLLFACVPNAGDAVIYGLAGATVTVIGASVGSAGEDHEMDELEEAGDEAAMSGVGLTVAGVFIGIVAMAQFTMSMLLFFGSAKWAAVVVGISSIVVELGDALYMDEPSVFHLIGLAAGIASIVAGSEAARRVEGPPTLGVG